MTDFLLSKISKTSTCLETAANLSAGLTPIAVTGTGGAGRALFCCAVCRKLAAKALYIVSDEEEARRACEDLGAFFGGGVLFLPARDIGLFSSSARSHEWEHERVKTLSRVASGDFSAVVATPEALLMRTSRPERLFEKSFSLAPGQTITREDLASRLLEAGYSRADMVEGRGQFAMRGGIVDIFPAAAELPVRLELWGDEIDSLGSFDPVTQRRVENLGSAQIAPASETGLDEAARSVLCAKLEALIKKLIRAGRETETLAADLEGLRGGFLSSTERYLPLAEELFANFFDYAEGLVAFVSDEARVSERLKSFYLLLEEDIKSALEKGLLPAELAKVMPERALFYSRLSRLPCVFLETFPHSFTELAPRQVFGLEAKQLSAISGGAPELSADVASYIERGYSVVLSAPGEERVKAVSRMLAESGIPVSHSPAEGAAFIANARLSGGLELPGQKLALMADSSAAPGKRRPRQRRAENTERIKTYSDLHAGDYVVHANHGIGLYMGIEKLTVQGVTKDYLKIKYSGSDVLYIPAGQLDLISKYLGGDTGASVKLSSIGGGDWAKTKSRVKRALADMADELIKLYAARQKAEGFAFSPDGEWQRQFEERFEFQETDDQLRSAEEIKRDMERPFPMDRLLCGDVGFGKTEVALRAVFKCVHDGRQAAILVPTTILAWQHYQTVISRFSGIPVNIDVMSRYRTKKQQAETARRLRRGEIDIIIGTHRLIQKDISFKNLGLAVVDEEQRFGVAHKERLKELTKNVDVLTLTATPIPRTLNMALTGIRDMSVMEEPPRDRHPVATYVVEYEFGMLCEAIRQELRRGGQVLFLHNRVDSIMSTAAKLQAALPDSRIAFAHGKMDEKELSEIWGGVVSGEIDLLVCTTIIETGIDLPNANTLIIEDADKLGLSQLYQLRGRVGRSHRRAYCYLTYRKGRVLTEDAEKRLLAIKEFTEFGSGFKIAMRDLEIRGAGNLLGAEQHGHMAAVGYDLYVKLLEEAVSEKRGVKSIKSRECVFDVNVSAHIPFDYIESGTQRIDIYKKISALEREEDYLDLCDELSDRFGNIPEEVDTLCRISLIRNMARSLGFTEISEKNGRVFLAAESLDLEALSAASAAAGGRLTFTPSSPPTLTIKPKRGNTIIDETRAFLSSYSKALENTPSA